MFTIQDGRESFYQWDIDRKLVVKDNTIKQVHFCNKTDDCSLVCETYLEDGVTVVNVPNVLLTTDWKIKVYAYDENYTKYCATFGVISRSKPADYVYTETEVLRWEDLDERITALEDGQGITIDDVKALGYMTQEEIEALGYTTLAEVQTLDYITGEELEEALDTTVDAITGLGYQTAADVKAYVDEAIGVIENGSY